MSANEGATEPRRPHRDILPIVGSLRSYDRRWLRGDLVAGIAVAALIVPKNLGYAGIAGIPLQHGLFAAAVGAIVYPLFGTCRQISTGPSSALAAVAASAVATAGITGLDEVAEFVALVTLISGVMLLALSLLRMGWIAQFLSRAVVTGFLFGAAIDVVIGELPKITGTDVTGDNPIRELVSWFGTLGDAQFSTVLVGGVALVVAFGLKKVAPNVPGALVLLVGGLLASRVFDLGDRGVAVVGDIPRGLPSFAVPDFGLLDDHRSTAVLAAVGLVLIGFSQTAGDSRMFATRHGYRVDIDQESLAQGMANVGAGVFRGMPVTTSLSASSLNDHSGARTGVASLATGVIVLLTLIVLAPLFSDLPTPVLGALIIEAVVGGMMDVPEMRRLARVQRFDFWVGCTAIASTLVFGVLAGVLIGIALSIIWLVSVSTRPSMPLLGKDQRTGSFVDLDDRADVDPVTGLAIVRLDGGLFFATADALQDRVRTVALSEPDVNAIVIDLEGVNVIDAQGSAMLGEILTQCGAAGVSVRIARAKPTIRALLERDGFVGRLGDDRIHATIPGAVEAHVREMPGPDNGGSGCDRDKGPDDRGG